MPSSSMTGRRGILRVQLASTSSVVMSRVVVLFLLLILVLRIVFVQFGGFHSSRATSRLNVRFKAIPLNRFRYLGLARVRRQDLPRGGEHVSVESIGAIASTWESVRRHDGRDHAQLFKAGTLIHQLLEILTAHCWEYSILIAMVEAAVLRSLVTQITRMR